MALGRLQAGPDVRFVVHYDLPKNIEGYYQETGRAGRDGLFAEALCLFGLQDAVTSRTLIEGGGNPEQVRVELRKLSAMIAFAELADMAARKPSTREEFLGCHGVGEAKLERYGEVFLAAIADHAVPVEPTSSEHVASVQPMGRVVGA